MVYINGDVATITMSVKQFWKLVDLVQSNIESEVDNPACGGKAAKYLYDLKKALGVGD